MQAFHHTGVSALFGCLVIGGWARADDILPEVRPEPVMPSGILVVFSKAIPSLAAADAEFDWEDNHYVHTPYAILRNDGSLFEEVRNHAGDWDEDPTPVSLPRGKYWIHARSSRDRWVLVPVEIREGAQTLVRLQP